MRATSFYVLFDKQDEKFHIVVDRTKVAQLIGCHTNTVKYRLRNGHYEDDKVIIGKSSITLSVRGGIIKGKHHKFGS